MRVTSAKSPFAASVSLHSGMILITVFSALTSIVLGMGSRAVIGTEAITNNDAAFLYLIDEIFGPFWRGLTGAAIYSAIMSTAAGLLLAAAAALSNDIIARIHPMEERRQTRMGRHLHRDYLRCCAVLLLQSPGVHHHSLLPRPWPSW